MNETPRLTMQHLLEQAYAEGWRRGIEAYSIWKDGRQLVGSGRYSLEDARKTAAEDSKPLFEIWLRRQRETFGTNSDGENN